MDTSNYHIVFYKPCFAEAIERNGSCCNRKDESKANGHVPLRDMVKMSKEKRGSSDVVADMSSKITVVCWKDNKFVNAISIFTGKQSIQQTKRYCHCEKWRMNIDKPI